jgi:lipid A 4'-phosphatase
MINNRLVNITLIAFGFLSLIFVIFPTLDIAISDLFYLPGGGFEYKDHAIITLFYEAIPILTKSLVIICITYLLSILVRFKNFKKMISSWAFFLVISAAIAPGLTVNLLLKDHFGRARPREIVEFGGNKNFSRPFVISDQCDTNCSFSSGHAAMGYYFSSIAYVASHLYFTRIYLASIFFGSIVGLSRIIMGGHFASDVIISAFLVLLLNHLIYLLWKKKTSELKI